MRLCGLFNRQRAVDDGMNSFFCDQLQNALLISGTGVQYSSADDLHTLEATLLGIDGRLLTTQVADQYDAPIICTGLYA